ncbi:phage tail protein [Kordiimonas laminariae]|uniref:phage tail protein n=1 Tax=Kordiimonas laminariae TaxID=2917717 RepID=UPI001FF69F1A|nr:tail fiber protein [Kordiimonas laminariae]MCK0071160.1 tail fiber protein [Kordiimonas laminariae]
MADPFIGEIRMFSGNFAPRGWFFCAGQYLDISQFTTLFSIIGTTYGGNGRVDFALPDLRGRVPIHWGNSQGPGLDPYYLGERTGYPERAVTALSMPKHTHSVYASVNDADQKAPTTESLPAKAYRGVGPPPARAKDMYAVYDENALTPLNPAAVSVARAQNGVQNTQYFDAYQPFQTCSFIINYDGIYPPRS